MSASAPVIRDADAGIEELQCQVHVHNNCLQYGFMRRFIGTAHVRLQGRIWLLESAVLDPPPKPTAATSSGETFEVFLALHAHLLPAPKGASHKWPSGDGGPTLP